MSQSGMYSMVVNGVTTYSNVPYNQSQPYGTEYTHTIHFNVPFMNYLYEVGLTLDQVLSNFVSELEGKGYHTWNQSYSTPDEYTLVIKYTASSPPVLIAIIVLLAVIAVIAYIIYDIVTVVVPKIPSIPPLTTTQVTILSLAALAIGVAAVGGAAYLLLKT